jgi:hypothetical protein
VVDGNEILRSLDGNNTDIIYPFYQGAGSANTADLQLLKKKNTLSPLLLPRNYILYNMSMKYTQNTEEMKRR